MGNKKKIHLTQINMCVVQLGGWDQAGDIVQARPDELLDPGRVVLEGADPSGQVAVGELLHLPGALVFGARPSQ